MFAVIYKCIFGLGIPPSYSDKFLLSRNRCSAWRLFLEWNVRPWSLWTDHLTFKLLVWCKKRMHPFGWNAIYTVYSIFTIMHQYEVPLLFWSPRCWSFASFEQRFADRSDLCKPLELLAQVIGSGLGCGVAGWSACFLIKDISFILFFELFPLKKRS